MNERNRENLEETFKNPPAQPENPVSDLALGVVFLIGGVYMIFAFSSFVVFLIGFGCALFGAASLAGAFSNSGQAERLGVPNSPASPELEKEILAAVETSGDGGLSPTEAALRTSLAAREADAVLSELASGGYLEVESRNGTLFYSLPGRTPGDAS